MKSLCGTLVAAGRVVMRPSRRGGPVPTWDKKISRPDRFKVLRGFNSEVCERGRVRSPRNLQPRPWNFRLLALNIGGYLFHMAPACVAGAVGRP